MASTQTSHFQTLKVPPTLCLVLVFVNQVMLQLDNGRFLLFVFDFQLLKQIAVIDATDTTSNVVNTSIGAKMSEVSV